LPVSPEERVEILALLTADKDAEIRQLALATLQQCTTEELRLVLTNPVTPAPFLELAVTHLANGREDVLEMLLVNPALPEALEDLILSKLSAAGAVPPAAVTPAAPAAEPVPPAAVAPARARVPEVAPAPAAAATGQGEAEPKTKGPEPAGAPEETGGSPSADLLALLSSARDAPSLDRALAELQKCSDEVLHQILANPATPVPILELAAKRLVKGREDLLEFLLVNPSLPERLQDHIVSELASLSGPSLELTEEAVTAVEPATVAAETARATSPPGEDEGKPGEPEAAPGKEEKEKKRETLLEKIGRMSAVEKIKAALTGNQETRLLLVRDSNKIVARSVLQSPKLSDGEMEAYASMKNVSEEVLRLIAMNRAFIKKYVVARALLNNPRAPIDVTLSLLPRMNEKDLKGLSLNRNVPEVIRSLALKTIKAKEEASKPKLPGKKH
jgi:hypothetical protein